MKRVGAGHIVRAGIIMLLCHSAVAAQEPVPFVNPHPLSASHFNPVMEGMEDRLELAYKHSSYYEEDRITFNGERYTRLMDFEASELSFFYKKSYNGYFFSMDAGVTHNHEGFLDNTIVYVHDHTGSTGGRWKRRKEAPRNEYHFSLVDKNGNQVFNEEKRWVYKADFYLGAKLPWGLILRGGVKPPIEANDSFFTTGDYEYAVTIQKSGRIGSMIAMADISQIWQAQDKTTLKVKHHRESINLFIGYVGYYIQFNYVDSVYEDTEDEILDAFGGVYTFGYRDQQWFWGITEDFSLYNSPDISLMVGYTF